MSGGIAAKVCGAALAFISSIILARILGSDGFGTYSFATAVMTMALVPAQLGIPSLIVRETASLRAADSWEGVAQLWRWALRISLISTAIVTLSMLIVSQAFGEAFYVVLSISAFTIIPSALNSLRAAMLRGAGHVTIGVIPEYVVRPLLLIVMASLLSLAINITAEITAILNVSACVLTYILGWMILKSRTPPSVWINRTPPKDKNKTHWLQSSIWLSLLASSQVISQQIDIILVTLLSEPAQAGVFKVAMSAAALIVFALNAVNLVTTPYFSRLLTQEKHEELQTLVSRTSKLTFSFAIPVCLVFFFASEKIISLAYGEEFKEASNCIKILSAGQLVNASFGAVSGLMTMARQQRTVVTVFTIALTLGVITSTSLIPVIGIEGAAIGSALSMVIWNICLAVIAYRRLGIWTFAMSYKK
jgi:O-antigen/teichoic acid export membrane protein